MTLLLHFGYFVFVHTNSYGNRLSQQSQNALYYDSSKKFCLIRLKDDITAQREYERIWCCPFLPFLQSKFWNILSMNSNRFILCTLRLEIGHLKLKSLILFYTLAANWKPDPDAESWFSAPLEIPRWSLWFLLVISSMKGIVILHILQKAKLLLTNQKTQETDVYHCIHLCLDVYLPSKAQEDRHWQYFSHQHFELHVTWDKFLTFPTHIYL